MIEQSIIERLVGNPSESLAVELKRWINPIQPADIAKIVKGAFALRNRNGGYFVVGFDDVTLAPDVANEPPKPKELFHVDVIQALISKYASDPFEVEVAWGERDGRQYPVIVVPSGVKVPVATKSDLIIGTDRVIKVGAVYFRSLASNGIPSTTEAKPSDWADIMETCFDNREADIGRFVRRHLGAIDLSTLMKAIGQPLSPAPTLCERAMKLIEEGEALFAKSISARVLSGPEERMLEYGFWSIGLVIDPVKEEALPDQDFLAKIGASNPKLTGWPMWLDARLMTNVASRPKVVSNAFEYLIVSTSSEFSNHIDFARMNPKGEFFLHRLLQDDSVPSRVTPGRAIDPELMILRVAEAMAVGVAFAKALGWTPDKTTLGFAFRWRGLKGRQLTGWANPFFDLGAGGTAHDDKIDSCVQFSLDTPPSAIPQFVEEATKRLFVAFDGSTIPLQTTDKLVNRMFERKLGF